MADADPSYASPVSVPVPPKARKGMLQGVVFASEDWVPGHGAVEA